MKDFFWLWKQDIKLAAMLTTVLITTSFVLIFILISLLKEWVK